MPGWDADPGALGPHCQHSHEACTGRWMAPACTSISVLGAWAGYALVVPFYSGSTVLGPRQGGVQGPLGLHSQCRLLECGVRKSGQGGTPLDVSLMVTTDILEPTEKLVCHSLQGCGGHPSGVMASLGLTAWVHGGGPGQSERWCGCTPVLHCCPLHGGVGSVPGRAFFKSQIEERKARKVIPHTYK